MSKKILNGSVFDVDKAYDMVSKEVLMINLYKMGIILRTFDWIKNILFDRYFHMKIRAALSTRYKIVNGTPWQCDQPNNAFYNDL